HTHTHTQRERESERERDRERAREREKKRERDSEMGKVGKEGMGQKFCHGWLFRRDISLLITPNQRVFRLDGVCVCMCVCVSRGVIERPETCFYIPTVWAETVLISLLKGQRGVGFIVFAVCICVCVCVCECVCVVGGRAREKGGGGECAVCI